MKKHLLPLLFFVLATISNTAVAQTTVCNLNAGPDQTICAPNCATLTATFTPTFQTTSYTQAQIPYAPDPFNVGTNVPLFDDQWSQSIPLPFTFCFYGQAYNNCFIGSNGVVTFNPATPPGGYCTWPIPNTPVPTNVAGTPVNCVMGPWQDLNPGVGGSVRYTTYGVAPCRRFVVSWFNVPMYSCGTPLTQQITLYETTNIIENYIQTKAICAWNGGKAIQAIQNQPANTATVIPGRNTPTQWAVNNEGRRYSPAGAPTSTVQWTPGPINGNPAVVCPNVTTTYTCTVTYTNCNNTTVVRTDAVVVNVSSLVANAGPDQNVCFGGCATLTANAPGATSYSWVTIPGNINVGNTQTINPCPLVTTTYVVTATDASNCSGRDTVVVNIFTMNTASAGLDDTICSGSCATLNASGGVSYLWNADPSFVGPINIPNPQACPLVTTSYVVTVTDANGCVGTDTVTIYVAPVPLSVNVVGTDALCNGACNGSATATGAGGWPPYSYSWSNAAVGNIANGLCVGQYTVTITDNIGCTATGTVTISEPTAVVTTATNIATANCGQNDGSVTISITGGTPNYTILWPSGNTNNLTETNLPPGQVCVIVSDANGCSDTLCVNVPNTPGAVVSVVDSSMVTCNNACDGWAVAAAQGGTGPYVYTWYNPVQVNDTALNLCIGTYTVVMVDANGCLDSATVTITQPNALQLQNVTGTATICIGQSTSLSAAAIGGSPNYNFVWTDGNNIWNAATCNVSPTVTTTYSVSVVDANNCTAAIQTVVVTVNPPLQVTAMANTTVCQGAQIQLTSNGSGGDGNLTYTWLAPVNSNGQNVNVTVNNTQTYTVVLTDGCGTPADSATVTITVNPAPVVTFAATSVTSGCEDLCVSFINNTPNTASISWVFGNNLGSSQLNNPTFCFTDPGTYDVTATVVDNIGCVGTTTLTNLVTVWPLPVADFSATPQPTSLLNSAITFTDQSIGAVSWVWSFGADSATSLLQNPTYTYQDTGSFNATLIVTNQYGCMDSTNKEIIILEDYAIYIPNTFTPNADGINDLFFPQGIGINPDNYEMWIFDRWGNLIYKTNTWPGGWDGTVQGTGRLCQIDTYVWKIVTTNPEGLRQQYVGHVNVVR